MQDKIDSVCIIDIYGNFIYRRAFTHRAAMDNNAILGSGSNVIVGEDCVCFKEALNDDLDLFCIMQSSKNVNEIFLHEMLQIFSEALKKQSKFPLTKEKVLDILDLVVVLVDDFVYDGYIICDSTEKLSGKLNRREFEGLKGIEVNSSITSFLPGVGSFFRKK